MQPRRQVKMNLEVEADDGIIEYSHPYSSITDSSSASISGWHIVKISKEHIFVTALTVKASYKDDRLQRLVWANRKGMPIANWEIIAKV